MSKSGILSRRDFLKLSSAGLLGVLLPEFTLWQAQAQAPAGQQGRVADSTVNVYDAPSPKAKFLASYWRDYVFPITNIVVSDDVGAYNRIWYQPSGSGYVYSGSIQPVTTTLNAPVSSLPTVGTLAEVTVPYTDAHWKPDQDAEVAYRLYYETTHWVMGLVHDVAGNPWYHLYDDKWKFYYFAQANHLRIIPSEELAPLSPNVPGDQKRIEVRLDVQMVIAYEGNDPVYMTRAATGGRFRTGTYSTPVGHYTTFHKRPYRHMAAGDLASNGYDLPGVPWVCYFTESGVSFHGTYWHNDFGYPRSHGCINLTPQAAKWLYRWTQPIVPPNAQYAYKDYGTVVDINE